ncbi:TolC family protein [candidate division WOR-3 bacterium]|nr:TolC family protein [candidate division WOR-3 bacterium]
MILFLFLAQVDSLSMDKAIDIAFSNSPSYYESKISLDKSRILYYQTLANLLPTVSVTGTYTKTEDSGLFTNPYSGSANLSVPIFDLDVIASIFIGGRQLKGTKIQHRADISALILSLKTAYYNLINARELLGSSEIAIKRARENLKLIETKYSLGAASKLEMLQGEVFELRALQDRAKARTLQAIAQEELKSILGITNDIFPTDTLIAPDSTDFPSLDFLVLILEEVNYNVQITKELRDVAKLDLIASYVSFLPKISFFYGYTYSSDSLIFDFQHFKDNSTKNYGINVSFPIFEIKSLIFNYLNAKKELQLKEFTKKRVILETKKSLRTNYYALREAHERLHFARKSLDAATEASTIAKEQYALGVISFLDFLTTEKSLYESRVAYISALSDFYTQRVNLSYFLGELSFNKERE